MFGAVNADAFHGSAWHWSHSGLVRPTIVFVDYTGSAWPVGSAAATWNQAHGVDSLWRSSCPGGGYHCVNVSEYTNSTSPDPGCVGAYGCTFRYPANSGPHWVSAFIILNDSTVFGSSQHRKSTCHELGHALSLEHQYTNGSCMTQGASPPISLYPDQHDFDTLQAIYAHNDG